MEYADYIEIWSTTPERALGFFGLSANDYNVVVLKDKPETKREIEKYRPEAKLYGLRRKEDGAALKIVKSAKVE